MVRRPPDGLRARSRFSALRQPRSRFTPVQGQSMSHRLVARIATLACSAAILAGCSHSGSTSAAPEPVAMEVAGLPAGVTASMIAVGDSIFHAASCQRCHGMDAKGTVRGPDLVDDKWAQIDGTYPAIVAIVTTGVPKAKIKMASAPFEMKARGGTNLSDEQIRDVAAYVYTLSHHS